MSTSTSRATSFWRWSTGPQRPGRPRRPLAAKVSLKLDDGSDYPLEGKLQFTDVTVNQTTGTVLLRALFPNPDGVLLPGLYVRAVINRRRGSARHPGAPAARRPRPQGRPHRPGGGRPEHGPAQVIKTGRTIGGDWQVLDGLKAGDKVIVQGPAEDLQPDMKVTPIPAKTARRRPARNKERPMALSRFFIDRPVFAWVIAIVIMLAGAIAALSLPVEQYPTIAPPAVAVNAFYPGADAATVQNSVTQVIEQQLTGLDNLLYFSSSSNADGSVAITATFAPGTNPDIAQVQVQNKVQSGGGAIAQPGAAARRDGRQGADQLPADRRDVRHRRIATPMWISPTS